MEAEDVLQTAYVELLDGRARFEGRSSFKTFVFGVVRRVAAARRRRTLARRWLLARSSAAEPAPVAVGDPERALDDAQQARRVRLALLALSRRQREVLELVFFHGMTVEEAAGVMQVSVGSARVHYARAKERLASALGEGAT